jgi:NCAIR mutase (PurE)-related protein
MQPGTWAPVRRRRRVRAHRPPPLPAHFEVIFGEGKTVEQITAIMERMRAQEQ